MLDKTKLLIGAKKNGVKNSKHLRKINKKNAESLLKLYSKFAF